MTKTAKIIDLSAERERRERDRQERLRTMQMMPFEVWRAAMLAIIRSIEGR